jgi:hypothetical protein
MRNALHPISEELPFIANERCVAAFKQKHKIDQQQNSPRWHTPTVRVMQLLEG